MRPVRLCTGWFFFPCCSTFCILYLLIGIVFSFFRESNICVKSKNHVYKLLGTIDEDAALLSGSIFKFPPFSLRILISSAFLRVSNGYHRKIPSWISCGLEGNIGRFLCQRVGLRSISNYKTLHKSIKIGFRC